MLTVKNLTKYILGEPLFEDASFVLHKKDKIGLVGPNGSGKSTLLKMIAGEIQPDNGDIRIEHERIGYLLQKPMLQTGDTIQSYLSRNQNSKIEAILQKVGLDSTPLNFEVDKLSGGQKTRLALAKTLLDKPTLLLLDEPTNNLDFDGLNWLENFIKNFNGGIIIVSHDRKLLDNCVNKILEIDSANHTFKKYIGGYTQYAAEKQRQMELLENEYHRQQKEKQRLEQWLALKRQEAHVYASPAKGRQVRAMKKRIQREIYDKEMARPKDFKKIKALELKGEVVSAKLVLRVENISKSFSVKNVLQDVNFELRGREHVLLAGKNGSGKTTLLKIIIGKLSSDNGRVRIGENVRFGYFSQEYENLNPDKSVLEEFLGTEESVMATKNPRSILGSFLFSGQDVFKKVSDLSFGEQVRLIFAKLVSQENHFLILDEPTNHLDIQSREVIESALLNYKGAILVVSHDRYFVDKISINRILTLQEGIIKESFV